LLTQKKRQDAPKEFTDDDVENAVAAMKVGAVNFIQKPIDSTRLLSTVSHALQTLDHDLNGLETEHAIQALCRQRGHFNDAIIAASPRGS
jgi:FixJ family two-component response regulator